MGKFMIIALGTLFLVMLAIFVQTAWEHHKEMKKGKDG